MWAARPNGTAPRCFGSASTNFCRSPHISARDGRSRFADLEPYYTEAEQLLGVRHFECEPDLARILGKVAMPGSEWQARPMPLALAADITAHRNEAAHFDGFASIAQSEGRGRGLDLSSC